MPQEKLALAKKLIGEGMDRHNALRRFIALGVSTEDFQDTFTQALKELGVMEPKTVMPTIVSGEKDLRVRKQKSPIVMMILACVAVVLFIGGVYLILTENIPARVLDLLTIGSYSESSAQKTSESPTFADAVLKKKIDSTMASVRIYKSRMLDYGGACKDVAVVPPIQCKEMTNSVVVYAKDSRGTLYCIDGTGKSGTRVAETETSIACR